MDKHSAMEDARTIWKEYKDANVDEWNAGLCSDYIYAMRSLIDDPNEQQTSIHDFLKSCPADVIKSKEIQCILNSSK
jgi:hypothetical protein